jgi:hypothetical protein
MWMKPVQDDSAAFDPDKIKLIGSAPAVKLTVGLHGLATELAASCHDRHELILG